MMPFRLAVLASMALACVLSFTATAGEGAGFSSEAARVHNELRSDQAVLSPGIAAGMESRLSRIERMTDKNEAARELRALDQDLAYSQSGLVGAYSPLAGPTEGHFSLYAPSDATSSPNGWGLPPLVDGWR
jgi:hypothetical protein